MAAICPTVTAFDPHEYRAQMERVMGFARRVHIDLMDGDFAPTLSPELAQTWWPRELQADIHLMYRHPADYVAQLISLKPSLVVIHFEADVDHAQFAHALQEAGIKVGLALLHDTTAEAAFEVLPSFDHILVFSGHLGYHGGEADLGLLDKVRVLRERFPGAEIAWDGGINDQNAHALMEAGVGVLNAGGFIQNAVDPQAAYAKLEAIA